MARPLVNPEIRKLVVERDTSCAYCGKPVHQVVGEKAPYTQRWRAYDNDGILFHFDHKLPLSAGGPNTPENIVLACPECNLKKARSRDKLAAHGNKTSISKVIKVSEEVYQELLLMQRPRETFSEIVGRLLAMSDLLMKAEPIIRGQKEYFEQRRAGQESLHPVD